LTVTRGIIIQHWRNGTDSGKPTYSETPPSQCHSAPPPQTPRGLPRVTVNNSTIMDATE
jgi:hypothetical protein